MSTEDVKWSDVQAMARALDRLSVPDLAPHRCNSPSAELRLVVA
jgi:hypothetical protein